jgi:hypothetical protein
VIKSKHRNTTIEPYFREPEQFVDDERMSCSILLILPAPCETPDTAVSSKPRTHAIDSELESEYDDAIFGDGDTDVESSVAAARLVISQLI